ncbi:glycosyltransferase [Geobacter sp. SVR]|uniref:glycosyltransferase n=1 Tax=Geobacter sp. SVR TaxID=2495594 RepID=UPI00143EF5FE|nr:glycosyltransferase [Geobacter sp. SVR]BCS52416.1 hypothetical protein GSVR_07240 [Geobacter sp. SVR]GCF87353.1 hypothetical protein GSbR_39530 [Geobacter sp. SVR]
MNNDAGKPGYRGTWLILSHGFNMDGRAASQTITDKIPLLIAQGVTPVVVSAQTGTKDSVVEHHQVPAIAPSGLKFDMRHILRKHIRNRTAFKIVKGLVSLVLLPFYLLERAIIHLESQWSWFVMAYFTGARLIKQHKPAIIYSTGGANSAHFAGYLLARHFGIPWIAELHDPMIHDQWRGSRMAYRWAAYLERMICRHASAAWWFTEMALARARERNPVLGERGHMIIPGVGTPDFQSAAYRKRDKLHFAHCGSLAESRNLAIFFEALHGLLEQHPQYRDMVQIDVYSSKLDGVSRAALERFPLPGTVKEHGRLETDPATGKSGRQQVLEAMRQTDVLLLLHGSDPFCEEYIPSKLFEYLWTKRPVLGLIWRNPQLERIMAERGHHAVNALDVQGLQAALLEIFRQWESDELKDTEFSNPFTVEDAVAQIVALAGRVQKGAA